MGLIPSFPPTIDSIVILVNNLHVFNDWQHKSLFWDLIDFLIISSGGELLFVSLID